MKHMQHLLIIAAVSVVASTAARNHSVKNACQKIDPTFYNTSVYLNRCSSITACNGLHVCIDLKRINN